MFRANVKLYPNIIYYLGVFIIFKKSINKIKNMFLIWHGSSSNLIYSKIYKFHVNPDKLYYIKYETFDSESHSPLAAFLFYFFLNTAACHERFFVSADWKFTKLIYLAD